MPFNETLALIIVVVDVVTIIVVLRRLHYRYYLRPKKPKSDRFFLPMRYPDDGEDADYCDICHGRLGAKKMAACVCGKRFHMECASQHNCPNCNNDVKHMFHRKPFVMRCPICIRIAPGGYCEHCKVIYPQREGTFKCPNCGTKVLTSQPQCKKCGKKYVAKLTKGYMNKVRSRR